MAVKCRSYPLVVQVHLDQNQQQNEEENAEPDHGDCVIWDTWWFFSTQTTCEEKQQYHSQIKAQYDS